MKIIFLPLLIMIMAMFSFPQTRSVRSAPSQCDSYVYERFRNYLENNEERATQIINQSGDLGLWESKTQSIRIGGNTVEWIEEVNKAGAKSSLKINDDLVTLWDKTTVNAPDGSRHFTLDMIDQWDQIKLYKLGDQTIIAVSMLPRMCTGLMCGVSAQLWYDVKTKQKTFFGEFRADSDVRLFRYPGAEGFYVLGTNFKGDPHGGTSPVVVRYELYKLRSDGSLTLQKNTSGKVYFIEHTMFPDMVLLKNGNTKQVKPPPDSLTQNWPDDVLASGQ